MKLKRILICGFFLGSGVGRAQNEGPILGLSQYLEQVKAGHQGVRANQELSEGAEKSSREADLLFKPAIFGQYQYMNDQKPSANDTLYGNRTEQKVYSLGIGEKTPFGLEAKLSYGLAYTSIRGAALLPVPNFNDSRWQVDLTQPLWKGLFGRESQAQKEAAEAQSLATEFGESFKAQSTLAEAESVYWNLALARENVKLQKESLDRSEKLKSWAAKRTQLELADKADLYQAEAAVELRNLEFQSAVFDEKSAAKHFNSFRGSNSDSVPETLNAKNPDLILDIPLPKRLGLRGDVKAAKELERATTSAAILGRERNKPSFDLFATFALNGHDPDAGTAWSNSLNSDRPTTIVGLKFSTPLDFWSMSDARQGYAQAQAAASLNFARKTFEEEIDWQDLSRKFEEGKERYRLARKIEAADEKKLTHERERLFKGRSTTFQVLQFEQELASSQLNRIKIAAEFMKLWAQLKLYGDSAR